MGERRDDPDCAMVYGLEGGGGGGGIDPDWGMEVGRETAPAPAPAEADELGPDCAVSPSCVLEDDAESAGVVVAVVVCWPGPGAAAGASFADNLGDLAIRCAFNEVRCGKSTSIYRAIRESLSYRQRWTETGPPGLSRSINIR